ncbi:transcriptional attenuator, LytR family [Nocardioides terrae]|uniref:Transcriptional attenuator, LytR family n=1 Tax=Nocardioides terrae TaxID=574651 RepID=A0A1I1IYQ5_9ACTN|nr:LCP family protein [Nocardioides terrae]SFC41427.1 transcriptional attenuator, LytR family [Nocardioides terrae]
MPPTAVLHARRTVLVVILSALVVLAVLTATTTVLAYRHLDGRLQVGTAIKHSTKKAKEPKAPLNILLLGIDSRDCEGCDIDTESGKGGSDTTILLHVAADRRSAYGISIPRDALVDRPSCTTADGEQTEPATLAMWNDAYAIGGAACTAQQVEALTGIYVDHYLTLNFAGFIKMVDAVQGVTVCIPEDIDDTDHHIHFDKGDQTLTGRKALDYVRERYSTANSDIGRMKRQQAFLASLINKVFSAQTLSQPARLYQFADALTGSITTDPDIDGLGSLVKLARQLRHADLQHIQFVTVPNEPYPNDGEHRGRVRILPSSKRLWQQVAADRPLGKGFSGDAINAGAPPNATGTPTPTGSPSGSASGAPSSTPSGSPTSTPTGPSAEEAAANGLCA